MTSDECRFDGRDRRELEGRTCAAVLTRNAVDAPRCPRPGRARRDVAPSRPAAGRPLRSCPLVVWTTSRARPQSGMPRSMHRRHVGQDRRGVRPGQHRASQQAVPVLGVQASQTRMATYAPYLTRWSTLASRTRRVIWLSVMPSAMQVAPQAHDGCQVRAVVVGSCADGCPAARAVRTPGVRRSVDNGPSRHARTTSHPSFPLAGSDLVASSVRRPRISGDSAARQ